MVRNVLLIQDLKEKDKTKVRNMLLIQDKRRVG